MNSIAVFSSRKYERALLETEAKRLNLELHFFEASLDERTARLAEGSSVASIFVNDQANHKALKALSEVGVKALSLRSAGFNHVDLEAARELGFRIARVPAYSPYAVAEHALTLLMTLNRKVHKAYNRVREGNFSLEGLIGYDLHGKTVGVVGTGKIGEVFCQILSGFGCNVLAFDPNQNEKCLALGVRYVDKEDLLKNSDVISLHCPLIPETRHFIDESVIARLKKGCVLVNTSRGALVKSSALIEGLKSGQLGGLALDVYEEEEGLFFEDHSSELLADDLFARLTTFSNVLITGHQAFFTREALNNICRISMENALEMAEGTKCPHEIS